MEDQLLELLSLLIGAALSVLAFYFRQWTGVQVSEKHKRILHDAMMTGATAAVKHGPTEGLQTMKRLAIQHVRQSAPEAVKYLVPGDTVLDSIAERYVQEAIDKYLPHEGYVNEATIG